MIQHSDLGSHGKLIKFKRKTPIRPDYPSRLPSIAFQDDTKEGFINLEL
jgi:hypothetical protein